MFKIIYYYYTYLRINVRHLQFSRQSVGLVTDCNRRFSVFSVISGDFPSGKGRKGRMTALR